MRIIMNVNGTTNTAPTPSATPSAAASTSGSGSGSGGAAPTGGTAAPSTERHSGQMPEYNELRERNSASKDVKSNLPSTFTTQADAFRDAGRQLGKVKDDILTKSNPLAAAKHTVTGAVKTAGALAGLGTTAVGGAINSLRVAEHEASRKANEPDFRMGRPLTGSATGQLGRAMQEATNKAASFMTPRQAFHGIPVSQDAANIKVSLPPQAAALSGNQNTGELPLTRDNFSGFKDSELQPAGIHEREHGQNLRNMGFGSSIDILGALNGLAIGSASLSTAASIANPNNKDFSHNVSGNPERPLQPNEGGSVLSQAAVSGVLVTGANISTDEANDSAKAHDDAREIKKQRKENDQTVYPSERKFQESETTAQPTRKFAAGLQSGLAQENTRRAFENAAGTGTSVLSEATATAGFGAFLDTALITNSANELDAALKLQNSLKKAQVEVATTPLEKRPIAEKMQEAEPEAAGVKFKKLDLVSNLFDENIGKQIDSIGKTNLPAATINHATRITGTIPTMLAASGSTGPAGAAIAGTGVVLRSIAGVFETLSGNNDKKQYGGSMQPMSKAPDEYKPAANLDEAADALNKAVDKTEKTVDNLATLKDLSAMQKHLNKAGDNDNFFMRSEDFIGGKSSISPLVRGHNAMHRQADLMNKFNNQPKSEVQAGVFEAAINTYAKTLPEMSNSSNQEYSTVDLITRALTDVDGPMNATKLSRMLDGDKAGKEAKEKMEYSPELKQRDHDLKSLQNERDIHTASDLLQMDKMLDKYRNDDRFKETLAETKKEAQETEANRGINRNRETVGKVLKGAEETRENNIIKAGILAEYDALTKMTEKDKTAEKIFNSVDHILTKGTDRQRGVMMQQMTPQIINSAKFDQKNAYQSNLLEFGFAMRDAKQQSSAAASAPAASAKPAGSRLETIPEEKKEEAKSETKPDTMERAERRKPTAIDIAGFEKELNFTNLPDYNVPDFDIPATPPRPATPVLATPLRERIYGEKKAEELTNPTPAEPAATTSPTPAEPAATTNPTPSGSVAGASIVPPDEAVNTAIPESPTQASRPATSSNPFAMGSSSSTAMASLYGKPSSPTEISHSGSNPFGSNPFVRNPAIGASEPKTSNPTASESKTSEPSGPREARKFWQNQPAERALRESMRNINPPGVAESKEEAKTETNPSKTS